MFKVCAACGATVDRKDCHRNRYGEYICRKCSAAGIKFTWHRRLRHLAKAKLRKFLPMLPVAGLALLLIWVLYEALLA
jgi:recombinational DNA repair protein (RecF pathway)